MANNEKKQGEKGNIVLGVYIHCPGCAEGVIRCLRGYEGVESVEVDSEKDRVMVKGGAKADPTKIAKRVRKKMGKHVDLISPLISPPKDKKQENKEEIKQPKVVEVTLKIYLHCEGCAKSVKRCIHKMPGVQTVETDMEKNTVRVKGPIEPEKLVKFVMKREGKHAEIVKSDNKKNQQNGEEEKKQKDRENGKDQKGGTNNWYENISPELFYAPQLFSDENPNSCSVM